VHPHHPCLSQNTLRHIFAIAGPIAERYFAERYKSLLLLLFAVQLLLFGAYTLSLPIGRSPTAVLPSSGMSLFVLFCAASAFLGGCLVAVVLPHAITASAYRLRHTAVSIISYASVCYHLLF
jgi:hypothetical protein